MKSDAPTEVHIVTLFQPENSFLSKIAEIRNRIAHRAYELFASRGFADGHDADDWFRAESELSRQMPIKVTETDSTVTVNVGVPGFTEKEIEVSVEPLRVFIGGKHSEQSENKEKGETIYSEFSNEVCRTIDLPAEIDPDKVKATLGKGDLEITMSKKEIAKKAPGKQISIETKAA